MADRNDLADPLMRAGTAICKPCGADAHPIDAAWIGDRILVTYAGCRHFVGRWWLIDIDIDDPQARALPAVPTRRCAGTTRNGNPCGQRLSVDTSRRYCKSHILQDGDL